MSTNIHHLHLPRVGILTPRPEAQEEIVRTDTIIITQSDDDDETPPPRIIRGNKRAREGSADTDANESCIKAAKVEEELPLIDPNGDWGIGYPESELTGQNSQNQHDVLNDDN